MEISRWLAVWPSPQLYLAVTVFSMKGSAEAQGPGGLWLVPGLPCWGAVPHQATGFPFLLGQQALQGPGNMTGTQMP